MSLHRKDSRSRKRRRYLIIARTVSSVHGEGIIATEKSIEVHGSVFYAGLRAGKLVRVPSDDKAATIADGWFMRFTHKRKVEFIPLLNSARLKTNWEQIERAAHFSVAHALPGPVAARRMREGKPRVQSERVIVNETIERIGGKGSRTYMRRVETALTEPVY